MRARHLRKLTNTGVALIATTPIPIPPYINKKVIPYTQTDITNNVVFVSELRKIEENYQIKFKNKELYEILKKQLGENFTINDLRKVRELTIDSLSNPDLSDLKYLINLKKLTIMNTSTINLGDLKYNINLNSLILYASKENNTNELQNNIDYLELIATEITDNDLFIPYNTTSLRIYGTLFDSFNIKNPSNLNFFSYNSFSILDLNCLSNCTNLFNVNISVSPNIKNSHILASLPHLTVLKLDDYAPIWLDKETLNSLNCLDEETKTSLLLEIDELDKIASSIISKSASDTEKIRAITLNISNRLEYDLNANGTEEEAINLAIGYNMTPIVDALKGKGVCINYACLFTALANRLGLDNYQDISTNHTWNLVKTNGAYKGYDITNIDLPYAVLESNNEIYFNLESDYTTFFNTNQEEQLYFYGFNPEEIPNEGFKGSNNIG